MRKDKKLVIIQKINNLTFYLEHYGTRNESQNDDDDV